MAPSTPAVPEVHPEKSQDVVQTLESLHHPESLDTTTTSPPTDFCCVGENCPHFATMQCPTCKDLNGPASYFCSQECFKSNWSQHSRLHPELRAKHNFVVPNIRYTGSLRPAYVSPRIVVTDPNIKKPDYAETGIPISERRAKYAASPIYSDEELIGIRAAASLTRGALDYAASLLQIGITTDEIDKKVHLWITHRGGYPSPLNYCGFPKSICTSINECICHGIPDHRPLQDGDIINLDVSVYFNGFHGDCSETHCIGNVDFESKRLIKASYDALFAAIRLVRPQVLFRDFGEAVSNSVRRHNFNTVKSYCGHGVGYVLHGAPDIPHYARNKAVGMCKANMVFCIEPMVNAGDHRDTHWVDEWTATTIDGKRSSQFEHTILCTADGYELLSARTENSKKLWWEEPENAADLARYTEIVTGKKPALGSGPTKSQSNAAKIAKLIQQKQSRKI